MRRFRMERIPFNSTLYYAFFVAMVTPDNFYNFRPGIKDVAMWTI
jgi:hypothetical protein